MDLFLFLKTGTSIISAQKMGNNTINIAVKKEVLKLLKKCYWT